MGVVRDVFAVNRGVRRWPVALKAAISLAIPLSVATALGEQSLGLISTLGAFTALYAPSSPGRFRARLMAVVGVGLVAAATLGALTAGQPVLGIAAMVLVAMVATFACQALKIGPPGAFFFILVVGVANLMAQHGAPVAKIMALVAAGAAIAFVVGLSDLTLDRHGPERRAVDQAERAVDTFEATRGPQQAVAARGAASTALHAAWTALRDGGGRGGGGPELQLLTRRLGEVAERYAAVSARVSAHALGIDPEPWGSVQTTDARRLELTSVAQARQLSERREDEVDLEQLRESSLGRPDAGYLLRAAARRPSEILLSVLRVGLATAIAGALSVALGLGHGYWAVAFSALVLHQGGTRAAQTTRGLQRLVGTLGGLLLFAVLVQVHPTGWAVVVILVVLQLLIELLVVRNYAAAVLFITPLALSIASAAAPGLDPWHNVTDRAVDTVVAVVVSLAVLWATGWGRSVLHVRSHGRRVIEGIGAVLQDLASGRVFTAAARANRRHLYYELLEADQVTRRAAADEPRAVTPYQAMEQEVMTLGYLVLGACWHPTARASRELFEQAQVPLRRITATPVTSPRPAGEITADVLAIRSVISWWRARDR
ncbi:FUSC family protein [Arsenicicoccus piscis]|uniref:FUSC family protein n=1 Tax=Arsenicicoccus piscis TaxID=673954 RepID=A0ABQ6HV58_9MICO|nr:FUSC family protein [Arsenicicoccus piscis]MCH8627407.1 FUSC family protein [Arsenicicoccus piscis]GMA21569.1 FUSC family protein [Arsenicicoccus piscis]